MDELLEDAAIEIYRRVATPQFTALAPLLLLGKKQSKLAFSPGVLVSLPLKEFFNNPEMANEGSSYRNFFLKCVSSNNQVAAYLESVRVASQCGDLTRATAMLFSCVTGYDYATFARGIFLIFEDFAVEGMETITSLFRRAGSVAQLAAIGNVVFRHLHIFRPVKKRMFSNIRVLASIPKCNGNDCNLELQCLNCFLYWYIIKFNDVLQ